MHTLFFSMCTSKQNMHPAIILLLLFALGMIVTGLLNWKSIRDAIKKETAGGTDTDASSDTGTKTGKTTGTDTGKGKGTGADAGKGKSTGATDTAKTTVTTTAEPDAVDKSPFRPLPKKPVKTGMQAEDRCEHVVNGGVCNDSIAAGVCSFGVQQSDGNVVMYKGTLPHAEVKFTGRSDGRGTPPYEMIMQWDGNLVNYDKTGRAVWASNTSKVGIPPHRVVMLDTCEIAIYDNRNVKIWSRK